MISRSSHAHPSSTSSFDSQSRVSYSNEGDSRDSFSTRPELLKEDYQSNMAADPKILIRDDLADPAMRSAIEDWLYMTQWHDAATRSDKLSKHRLLADLDRQQDMLNRQRSELLGNHEQHMIPSADFQSQDDKQEINGHGHGTSDKNADRHRDHTRSRSEFAYRPRSREPRHSPSRCDRRWDDYDDRYRHRKEHTRADGHRDYREREYEADNRPSSSYYRRSHSSRSHLDNDPHGYDRRHLDRYSLSHRSRSKMAGPEEAKQIDIDQGKRRDEGREALHLEYPIYITLGDNLSDTRYFVMRSYTYTHIYDSQDEGLWATQTSNEDKLRLAFEETPNVILFFSKNRSHAFQGYARMTSAPSDDPNLKPRWYNGVKWPLSRPFSVQWLNKLHCEDRHVTHLCNNYNEDLGPNRAKDGQEVDPVTGKDMVRVLNREAISTVNHTDRVRRGGNSEAEAASKRESDKGGNHVDGHYNKDQEDLLMDF